MDSKPKNVDISQGHQHYLARQIYATEYGLESIFGKHIHHIDGDEWNNDITNLIAVTQKEHALLHKILRQEKKLKSCPECKSRAWDKPNTPTGKEGE